MHPTLKLLTPVLGLLWAFTGVSHADSFTSRGTAYRVVDGDTVARGKQRMRVLGIDAPETRGGNCPAIEHTKGRGAKQYLVSLLTSGKRVTLRRYKRQRDRYGREVVQIWVNGRNVAGLMIKAGHARAWNGTGPRPDWCEVFNPSGNTPISPSGNTPATKRAPRVRG
jgi:endonuclease YncB( thermonuclease family)